MIRSQRIIESRSYQDFVEKIMKIEDSTTFSNQRQIKRYGITIFKEVYSNKNYGKLEEFFFYYFKERVFKEYEMYGDKDSNPLLYLDRPVKDFCSAENANRLIKKLVNSNYQTSFFIWGTEILKFEEIRTPKK